MRATLLAKSRVYWSGGCLTTCLLGYYLLEDNSWRTLLFIICLPGIYALYEHKVSGKESLRYLWVQKRVDEVVEVTNSMCQLNNKPEISRSEIDMLIAEDAGDTEAVDVPLSEMFNKKYKASTIRLILSWFTVCFIYYGVMLLLPTILQRVFTNAQSK
jgi:MFS family permease